MNEQWVTMTIAANMLNITQAKVSRLAAINAIAVKLSKSDRRIKLVNVTEVKKVIELNEEVEQISKEVTKLERKTKISSQFIVVTTREELIQCLNISRDLFGIEVEKLIDIAMERITLNPEICYAVKNNNQIVGYVMLSPIKANRLDNVLNQRIPVVVNPDDLEIIQSGKTLELYINVMGISPNVSFLEKRLYGFRLVSGIIKVIKSFGERGINIQTISARTDTKDGIRLLKNFGFTEIERATPERRTFIINVKESGIPFMEQYKQALKLSKSN